jgi:hypothetical protein
MILLSPCETETRAMRIVIRCIAEASTYFTWILTPYNTLVRSREQNYGVILPRTNIALHTVSKTQKQSDALSLTGGV